MKKLTAEGAKVLAVDIHQENVEATAKAVPEGSCFPHVNDVTLESAWRDILDAALKNFGKLDIVVNCAGVVHIAAPSHEVPEDQFDAMFRQVRILISNRGLTELQGQCEAHLSFVQSRCAVLEGEEVRGAM